MVPPAAPKAAEQAPSQPEAVPETTGAYLKRRITELTSAYRDYGFNFAETRKSLIDGGLVPDVPSATMTMEQARELIGQIEAFYEYRKAAS